MCIKWKHYLPVKSYFPLKPWRSFVLEWSWIYCFRIQDCKNIADLLSSASKLGANRVQHPDVLIPLWGQRMSRCVQTLFLIFALSVRIRHGAAGASCLRAASQPSCDPQGCVVCLFAMDRAWKINVMRPVWLSTPPLISTLDPQEGVWGGEGRGIHHCGILLGFDHRTVQWGCGVKDAMQRGKHHVRLFERRTG